MTSKASTKSKASAQMTSPNGRSRIKVGIVGGAGYTGGELIRLLIHHQYVAVSFIHSRSNAGNLVSSVHQDLIGETNLKFADSLSFEDGQGEIDVLFLCVG